MTVSEARAALPEVLDRVADGEEITITRHGRPVAVVIRPDVIWSRSRAEHVLGEAPYLLFALGQVFHQALLFGGHQAPLRGRCQQFLLPRQPLVAL